MKRMKKKARIHERMVKRKRIGRIVADAAQAVGKAMGIYGGFWPSGCLVSVGRCQQGHR